ncbi:hypothetical protein K438DRAFT_1783883 [Mycena galopus ATCC 62051]|nr:hypothetical protein K438DRAFT_1783883 [Mycena galopus ATCC 62051]
MAQSKQRAALPLILRIVSINMAAIHTSSMGWSKAALNSMVKINSFLRESQRLNNKGPVGMSRKILAKDGFRFSNANYENAATFDGFRFARERAEHMAHHDSHDEQAIFKHQMISTAVDHLPFGTGKHAWPLFRGYGTEGHDGAFGDGVRCQGGGGGSATGGRRFWHEDPNPTGKVQIRKRQ